MSIGFEVIRLCFRKHPLDDDRWGLNDCYRCHFDGLLTQPQVMFSDSYSALSTHLFVHPVRLQNSSA